MSAKSALQRIDIEALKQHPAPRYALVGVLNTLVGIGSFYLFRKGLGWQVQTAVDLSWLIGLIHSYLWNRYWAFRSTGAHSRELPKFIVINLVQLGVNKGLMALLTGPLHIWDVIAPWLVIPFTMLVSYFGYRYWGFRTPPRD